MSKDNYLLSNLTDWIIPTFHPEDPTVSPLPVSIPSLNYTFVLDSTCSLSLTEQEDSLIFQQATNNALSELYNEYFGSDGRAKFQNMTLQLQTWDMSLPSFPKSTRRIQRTRKYTLPQTNLQQHQQQQLQLGYNGEAFFQYSPPPNEQLLQAINEHLLSSPQLLTQMGQTIVQQLILTHNTSNNNTNNSFCANSTSFQILTKYTNTTPLVLPSVGTSQDNSTTGIYTNTNNNLSSTQIETLGADQTTSIGSTNSPFAETISNIPSTEDLTTTTNNNSNTPVHLNNGNTTTTQTTTTSQSSSQSTILIVGIAVFSSIILIIGLGFLYAFIQKRKRLQRPHQQKKQHQQHDYSHEEDRATSVIRDDDDRSIEEAADFFYNHAELYSPQEEQPAITASMTKNTNSLLSPTITTAAAVLLASKSTNPKNTTTTINNNSSRMYNRLTAAAPAAAHLDEYDICARSTYTLESEQQPPPSLGPQSLAESIPLEDILNTQSNNNNNNTTIHYANQSVQLETIIRSLTEPTKTSTTSIVPPPSVTVAPPTTTLTPTVLLPVSSTTTLKKTVSFSEPEQPHEKKPKSPSYSATSSSLLSSYNITNESSWRFTQPSRFVGDEPNNDLPKETNSTAKNHEVEEVSLAESSLCMSKKDLIDLIGVARNKSKEEDYALHRLLTAKQSFVQTR